MTVDELIAALHLPAECRVDRTIPRSVLAEQAAGGRTDRRLITTEVQSATWVASLKPHQVGVAAWVDEFRVYDEIAVVRVELASPSRVAKVAERLHRAIPYPLILLHATEGACGVSAAHKRRSLGDAAARVLDGDVVLAAVRDRSDTGLAQQWVSSLALDQQPSMSLLSLYGGWIAAIERWHRIERLGPNAQPADTLDPDEARRLVAQFDELRKSIDALLRAAETERHLGRRAEINVELQRQRKALALVVAALQGS